MTKIYISSTYSDLVEHRFVKLHPASSLRRHA